MSRRLQVGIDVDGVLYDFTDAMREWYFTRHGIAREAMPIPEHWHIADAWPHLNGDHERFFVDCQQATRERHLSLWGPAVASAQMLMHYLAVRGYDTHVITARDFGLGPEWNYELTNEWFRRERLPFTTLTISRDKTAVETDVFLDDKPENIDAVLAVGTLGIMRSQPWNTHRTDLPTVHSLEEFMDITDQVAAIKEACNG